MPVVAAPAVAEMAPSSWVEMQRRDGWAGLCWPQACGFSGVIAVYERVRAVSNPSFCNRPAICMPAQSLQNISKVDEARNILATVVLAHVPVHRFNFRAKWCVDIVWLCARSVRVYAVVRCSDRNALHARAHCFPLTPTPFPSPSAAASTSRTCYAASCSPNSASSSWTTRTTTATRGWSWLDR